MKTLLTKFFISVFMLLNLGACGSDHAKYCDFLTAKLDDPKLEKYLFKWLESSVLMSEITRASVVRGGGMVPGQYHLLSPGIDWGDLGFRNDSQVRLVSSVSQPFNLYVDNLVSVFLGQRSGFGLLLLMPGATEFGVEVDYIKAISKSGRVAVMCKPR